MLGVVLALRCAVRARVLLQLYLVRLEFGRRIGTELDAEDIAVFLEHLGRPIVSLCRDASLARFLPGLLYRGGDLLWLVLAHVCCGLVTRCDRVVVAVVVPDTIVDRRQHCRSVRVLHLRARITVPCIDLFLTIVQLSENSIRIESRALEERSPQQHFVHALLDDPAFHVPDAELPTREREPHVQGHGPRRGDLD